jgi:hypothetical protein
VGALLVVLESKPIKHLLLSLSVAGRRSRRLVLQRSVHALMTSILLGMARLDLQRLDPQPDPPHRQPRESRHSRRRKRSPIIGHNRPGEPRLSEHLPKDPLHRLSRRRIEGSTGQQISALIVGDRERITVPSILGSKLSLEVGREHLVGSHRSQLQRRPRGTSTATASLRRNLSGLLEDLLGRRGGRPLPFRLSPTQPSQQGPSSPVRVLTPSRNQGFAHGFWGAMRALVGSPASILQSCDSSLSVALQPLVGCLPTHSIALTELAHLKNLTPGFHHKP